MGKIFCGIVNLLMADLVACYWELIFPFFDIGEIEEGDFFIKFKLRNKQDGFQWFLVSAVYGATQQEFKEVFLTELVHFCSKETLPMLIGGDFNIIRGPHEKNNGN